MGLWSAGAKVREQYMTKKKAAELSVRDLLRKARAFARVMAEPALENRLVSKHTTREGGEK